MRSERASQTLETHIAMDEAAQQVGVAAQAIAEFNRRIDEVARLLGSR